MHFYRSMQLSASQLLIYLLASGSSIAHAAEVIGPGCPADRITSTPLFRTPAKPAIEITGITRLRADKLEAVGSDVTEMTGNTEMLRDGQQVRADSLRYDRKTSQADATGNVTITTPEGGRFFTNEAHFGVDQGTGYTLGGSYHLPGDWGRGDMERVEFHGDKADLSNVRFTTCPLGQDDWYLGASKLEIDTAEDIAVARNVTFDFLGVPVLYLPYLSFPISDRRKTGFLMPQIGYDSTRGAIFGTPYYLNLAPAYDATVTPRWLTERGFQVETEFRYLGRAHSGELNVEYLPEDQLIDEYRAAGTFVHRHTLGQYWSGAVDLRGVSDKDYVADFGDTLSVTSGTHLLQNAEVNYRGPIWTFTGRVAGYQTVDRTIPEADRPYARLPQLLLSGTLPSDQMNGLQYRFGGELVNFQRDQGVTAQRINVNPSLALNRGRSWGFVAPEVGVRHINYELKDAADTRPSVTAPFLSIDSGLFFDRLMQVGDNNYTHTLEPRFYYLYVPYRTQDDLPNFDTSVPDFTFANLFRNNRFVGGDRIGDANQITLALTSRIIDQADGRERLRASIGRIHYFDERRINVPPATIDQNNSDIVAEAAIWLPHNWHVRTNIQWTAEQSHTTRGTFYLQHQPRYDRIVNLGYRLIRNQLEQTDVSFEWPLWNAWTALGRSIYSVRDNENIESYVGVKYSACCWAVRLFAARRLTQTTGLSTNLTEQRASINFELELSGLASAGTAPQSPLGQGLYSFPQHQPPPAP